MRIGRGGLESSSWPKKPYSAVPRTPGEVLGWSWSAESSDGDSLGSAKGLNDSGVVHVDKTVVDEEEASIMARFEEWVRLSLLR